MTTRPTPKNGGELSPNDFQREVGNQVKAARIACGLSLAELSELANIAQSYLYTIEQKGTNLSLTALKKLADALNVSPRDLMPAYQGDDGMAVRFAALVSAIETTASLLQKRRTEDDAIARSLRDLISFGQVTTNEKNSGGRGGE